MPSDPTRLTLIALILALPAGAAAAAKTSAPGDYILHPSPEFAATHDGLWSPSTAEMERAKAALLEYLSTPHPVANRGDEWNERNRPIINEKIRTYMMQFAGVRLGAGRQIYAMEGSGPKAILVTGLCDNFFDADLEHDFVTVDDGGYCFFISIYDPALKRITDFRVNGVA